MNPTTCLRCGAHLSSPPGLRCDYCGTELAAKPISAPSPAPVISPAEKTVPVLPSELPKLKRPKPNHMPVQSVFLLLFAIPWTLCSLLGMAMMAGTFINEQATYNRLRDEGVTVRGAITRLEEDNSGDSTSYDVYYRFSAPVNGDRTTFENYDSVSQAVYNSLEAGGSVEVIYVRSDPKVSAVKADWRPPDNMAILFMCIFGLFGLGIGAGMLTIGIRAGKRFLDLRTRGELAQGIVFDRWEESGSDSTSYYVAYAYQVPRPGSQLFTGAKQSGQAYRKLHLGDQVSLRYLPDNPKISTLADFWW